MKILEEQNQHTFFKKFKTYSASEVIAAGGASEFARLRGHNPKRLYKLKGEHLSEEDFNNALIDLERK
jgi:hypothetical protein